MPDTHQLLTHFYVEIGGAQASETFMHDLEQVVVETSLHLPDVATLTLHDSRMHWLDEALVAPGTPLKVSARGTQAERPLFDGEIVELEPDFDPATPRLIVRAFDRLHRLARGRHVRSFVNVSDADVIRQLAREARLETRLDETRQVHSYLLQANESNLDFLRARAAALGYLLYVEGETLHCVKPEPLKQALQLQWGASLLEFHPRLTTIGQVSGVTVRGWDPVERRELFGEARVGDGAPAIGLPQSGGELAQAAFKLSANHQVIEGPIRSQASAEQLAQAVADRLAQRFVEAEGVCGGDPALVAGVPLQISAVGQRFSGTYFVTGARHRYAATHGYQTHFSVSGLHGATLLSLLAPEPAPLGTGGPVVAIVTENRDPQGQGRVRLRYPWLSSEHSSDWARIVVLGGGNGRGMQFLPEVNDEVLVAFEMGDINYPYVLGGLWNGRDRPPEASERVLKAGQVQQRIICSRNGHRITLDDDEAGGKIIVEDAAGNTITLDSQERSVTISSAGDLTLSAKGKMKLNARGIEIDGQPEQVDVKGAIINLN